MDEVALNLGLLFPTNDDVRVLLETTSTDIFDGTSKAFAQDGLYSTRIYDVIGSPARYSLFSYKHLGVPILHPKLYIDIISLSGMFEKIVTSKMFVIYNEKTKEFEESDVDTGFTGYSYFMKYVMDMKLPTTDSEARAEKIKTIEVFRSKGTIFIDNIYILPAGMREYKINEDGRDEEDEINDFYKSIIRLSNMLINSNVSKEDRDILDPTIVKLQNTIVDLYEYIINLMNGKHKRIRGSWLTRDVDSGTRNILSSIPTQITDLDDKDSFVGFNDTIVGVYQYIMMYAEMMRFHLLNKVLYSIFDVESGRATLFDMKTYKSKQVTLKRKEFELWTTVDGINNIMFKMANDKVLNSDIVVNGNYLLLKEDVIGETYIRFNSEDIVDIGNITPLTYGELFMIITTFLKGKVGATLTRYPITRQGSNFLTIPVIYSTSKPIKTVVHLPSLSGDIAIPMSRFPTPNGVWVNTIGVSYTRIYGLNADSIFFYLYLKG